MAEGGGAGPLSPEVQGMCRHDISSLSRNGTPQELRIWWSGTSLPSSAEAVSSCALLQERH